MTNTEPAPPMKAYTRVTDTSHMVDIDVPISMVNDVYHVILHTRGIIGYKGSFITPDAGCYDTLTIDLGSLPAVIEQIGIGPVGEGWLEEQREEFKNAGHAPDLKDGEEAT